MRDAIKAAPALCTAVIRARGGTSSDARRVTHG